MCACACGLCVHDDRHDTHTGEVTKQINRMNRSETDCSSRELRTESRVGTEVSHVTILVTVICGHH